MGTTQTSAVSRLWEQSARSGKTPLIQRLSLRDLQRERDRLSRHIRRIQASIDLCWHKAVDLQSSRARKQIEARNDLLVQAVFKLDMVLFEMARRADNRDGSRL